MTIESDLGIFEVDLMDDGTLDTVIRVVDEHNRRSIHKFDPEFVDDYRDDDG